MGSTRPCWLVRINDGAFRCGGMSKPGLYMPAFPPNHLNIPLRIATGDFIGALPRPFG